VSDVASWHATGNLLDRRSRARPAAPSLATRPAYFVRGRAWLRVEREAGISVLVVQLLADVPARLSPSRLHGNTRSYPDLQAAAALSRFAHTTVFTGLFFRDEIAAYCKANGLPEPYDDTARR
jgi:hypothetical protein